MASCHGVRLALSQHRWLLRAPASPGGGQAPQERRQQAQQQRSPAVAHSGHPRRSQGRVRLPQDVGRISHLRLPSGHGARAAHDARVRHQSKGQAKGSAFKKQSA